MKLSEQIRELQPSSGLACDGSFLFGWRQAAEQTAQLVEEHEAEAANDRQIRQRKMDELGNDILRLTHDNAALTKRVAELESILGSRVAAGKRLAERLRAIAEALRELSPGPHPGPMDAEDYVPLVAKHVAELEAQLTTQQRLPPECRWANLVAENRLIRRVYFVATDPAEVVAELRRKQRDAEAVADDDTFLCGSASGIREAAELVAEKLGGK